MNYYNPNLDAATNASINTIRSGGEKVFFQNNKEGMIKAINYSIIRNSNLEEKAKYCEKAAMDLEKLKR